MDAVRLWLGSLALALCEACAATRGAPLPASQTLVGAHGAYSLLPMTAGWSRLPVSESGGSDLVLGHEASGVVVAVNVHLGAEQSIDGVVGARRARLAESDEMLSFSEERSFRERSDFAPVSIARYRMRRDGQKGWYAVLVGTAKGSDAVVELLALGGPMRQREGLLEDLLAGLQIPADAAGSSP